MAQGSAGHQAPATPTPPHPGSGFQRPKRNGPPLWAVMIYDLIYASSTSGNLLMHRRVVSVFHSDRFTPSAVAGYLVTFSRQCQAALGRRPTCLRLSRYAISICQTDLVLAAVIHDPEDTEGFTLSVCESLASLYHDNLHRIFTSPGRSPGDVCNTIFLRLYRQYVAGAVFRLLAQIDSQRCVEQCCISLGDQALTRLFGRPVLTPPRSRAPGETGPGRGRRAGTWGSPIGSPALLGDRASLLFEAGTDFFSRLGPHQGFLTVFDIRLGPERRLRAYSLHFRTILIVVYGGLREEALRSRTPVRRLERAASGMSLRPDHREAGQDALAVTCGSAPTRGAAGIGGADGVQGGELRGIGGVNGASRARRSGVSSPLGSLGSLDALGGLDSLRAQTAPAAPEGQVRESQAREGGSRGFTGPESSAQEASGAPGTPGTSGTPLWREWDVAEQEVRRLVHSINEVLEVVSSTL